LALTPCLTNAVKRPDNSEFSETFFRSHDGRGKILKFMKAQANGIICSGMTENIYLGALIVHTSGKNRVKNDYTVY
jgi:hypothetical protein